MAFLTIAGGIYSSGVSGEGTASLTGITDADDGYTGYDVDWHPSSSSPYYIALGHAAGGSDELSIWSFNGSALSQVETVNLTASVFITSWHPNGNYLAVGSDKAGAQLKVYSWNGSDTLTEVETINYGGTVRGLSWDSDGSYLAIGGYNASKEIIVYSWNGSDTLTEVETIDLSANAYDVEFDSTNSYLAVACGVTNEQVKVYGWNGSNTLTLKDSYNYGSWTMTPSWSVSNDYLFVGGPDATNTVVALSFDGTSLAKVTSLGYGANYRAQGVISNGGNYLMVSKYVSTGVPSDKWLLAYKWDEVAETLTETSSLTWTGYGINDSFLSHDNAYLASSVYRHTINYVKTIKVSSTGLNDV